MSSIWKAEFQFQTVWFICQSQRWWKHYRYYGKHDTKQFIRGKLVRFGFKLWYITSSKGYLLNDETYCGSETSLSDTGLSQGADVVLCLIGKCNVKAG